MKHEIDEMVERCFQTIADTPENRAAVRAVLLTALKQRRWADSQREERRVGIEAPHGAEENNGNKPLDATRRPPNPTLDPTKPSSDLKVHVHRRSGDLCS